MAKSTPTLTQGQGSALQVKSVGRVFAVLEAMAAAQDEIGLVELADTCALPVPTIHRLLRTLVALGYVRQETSRKYSLGPGLIRLGEGSHHRLGAWARPHLAAVVAATGETTNLAKMDGDLVAYVAQAPSPHLMRMFTGVGRRVLPHCTGVGKALVAQLPDDEIISLLDRLGMPAQTARTITKKSAFLDEVARVRERGYAVDEGEQEVGVRCVAVPMSPGSATFALSISGPDGRMTDELIAKAVPMLRTTAAGLAAEFGRALIP